MGTTWIRDLREAILRDESRIKNRIEEEE